jgi:hypothetical protein
MESDNQRLPWPSLGDPYQSLTARLTRAEPRPDGAHGSSQDGKNLWAVDSIFNHGLRR